MRKHVLLPLLAALAVSLASANTRGKAANSGSRSGQSGVAGSGLKTPVKVQLSLPALNSRDAALPRVPLVKPAAAPSPILSLPALPPPAVPVEPVVLPAVESPEPPASAREGGDNAPSDAVVSRSRERFDGQGSSLLGRLAALFSRPDLIPEWPAKSGDRVRVGGKSYVLGPRLGEGSGSIVYYVDDQTVVKLIYPGLAADPSVGREAESLEALAHAHIPHSKLLAKSEDGLVLVKRFVPGETLGKILKTGPLRQSQKNGLADLGAKLIGIGYGADLNPGNLIWDHWRGAWTLVDGGGFAFAEPAKVFEQLASPVLREHGELEPAALLSALRGRLGPDSPQWERLIAGKDQVKVLADAWTALALEDSRRPPAPRLSFGSMEPDPIWTNEVLQAGDLSRRLGFDPTAVKDRFIIKRDRVKTNTEVWRIPRPGGDLVMKESDVEIIRREVAVRGVIRAFFAHHLGTPDSLAVLRGHESFIVMELAEGGASYMEEADIERRVAMALLARTFGLSDVNRDNVFFAPGGRVTLIDFEQAFSESAPIPNRLPNEGIVSELPWVSLKAVNALEDYLPAAAAWRVFFKEPQTQAELARILARSGYAPAEIKPLLAIFKGNVERLERTIQSDVELANAVGAGREP